MLKLTLSAAGLALMLANGPAAGQQNPVNTPPPSAGRPIGWGEQDTTINPSPADQVVQGARRAATERAAAAGRRGRFIRTRPATPAEIVAGSTLADPAGALIGIVESVTPDGAVVSSGAVRVMVPLDAFGTDGTSLLLGITKAEFDAVAAGAQP